MTFLRNWKVVSAYVVVALTFASLAAWGLSAWLNFDFVASFAVVALAALPIGLAVESQLRSQVDLLRPDRRIP
jgi:hypothetical protein